MTDPQKRFYVRSMTDWGETLNRGELPTLTAALEWVAQDTEKQGGHLDDFMLIGDAVRLTNTLDMMYRIIDTEGDMLTHWNALHGQGAS